MSANRFDWFDLSPAAWSLLDRKGWSDMEGPPFPVQHGTEVIVPVAPPPYPACSCPATGYTRPIHVGRAGGCRSFLDRESLVPADRLPMPLISLAASKINRLPMQPPLPLPPLQTYLKGMPPPDRGVTDDWPHPTRQS